MADGSLAVTTARARNRSSPVRYARAVRIIYSTPRLENAERVASLLEADGVATRLLYGPRFRRNTWRGADYGQPRNPGDWPRVLVLNNGDLPKARAVLRQAGLMAPAAFDRDENTADAPVLRSRRDDGRRPMITASRIRIALIVMLLAVAAIQGARYLL